MTTTTTTGGTQPAAAPRPKVKVIKYFRTSQWGNVREFIHPDNDGDLKILRALTGRSTIDGRTRELVRDLTAGAVDWMEVIAP